MNEVKAAKHLGQHFLRDEAVIARLLAVINAKAGEAILEIGPGLGALTLPLLRQTGAMTAVEYDPRVLAPLAKKAATLGTLHLIHADILTIDFGEVLAKQLPPPVGEGRGGGSEHPASAPESPPSPCGGGAGGGVRPHPANAELPTDAKKPLSLWDTQRSREARDRGWGEGEKSEGSEHPASAPESLSSPSGGEVGGGVHPHTTAAKSPTDLPPPPVGEGWGGSSKHPASAPESLPSSCGGGAGGGVRPHTANAESPTAHRVRLGAPQETGTITALHSPTETPPPPVGEGRGGGSKHPAPATKQLRLVGNLPYNLSSPILFHCLAQREHIHDMHYMLQKEVVDRITAAPGSKTYGRLSLMAQLWCETTALFDIPPDAFDPPPKVDSAVVRLVPRAAPAWQIDDLATFEETVRLAFAQRRKMLRKTFAHWMNAAALEALDIDPTARAETLDGAAFARLANAHYQQERQK